MCIRDRNWSTQFAATSLPAGMVMCVFSNHTPTASTSSTTYQQGVGYHTHGGRIQYHIVNTNLQCFDGFLQTVTGQQFR